MAVVVTAAQGAVWVSMSPPVTGDAIMEPGKVDELVHVLKLAQQEAKKMAIAPNGAGHPCQQPEMKEITD
jgi:hypothetical protein